MEYIAKNIQNKKLSESKFGTVSHYKNSEHDKILSKKKKKKEKKNKKIQKQKNLK